MCGSLMKLLQTVVDLVLGDGDITLRYILLLPLFGKDEFQEGNHDRLGGLAMRDEEEIACRWGRISPISDGLD